MSLTELLEVLAGEFTSAVQHNVPWSPVVSHILPQVFWDLSCVPCFKGEEPNESTIMINYCKDIPVTLDSINHVSNIYANSFQRSVYRWEVPSMVPVVQCNLFPVGKLHIP